MEKKIEVVENSHKLTLYSASTLTSYLSSPTSLIFFNSSSMTDMLSVLIKWYPHEEIHTWNSISISTASTIPAEKQSLLFLVVVRTHRVTVKKETII